MAIKLKKSLLSYTLLMLVLSLGLIFVGCGKKEEEGKKPRAEKKERELPAIVITEPSFTEMDSCTVPTISLAGLTVKELESVHWANNRGGSGIAKGTINWRVQEVVLQPGENIITISAKDSNTGELYKTEVKVTYVPVKLLSALEVKPDTAFMDAKNEVVATIKINPDPKLNRDKVELYRTYEDGKNMYLLGLLTDDGDLNNGDKIADDKIWSCKFILASGKEREVGLKRVGQTADELSELWGLFDKDVGKKISVRVSAYLLEEDGSFAATYSNQAYLSVKEGAGK